MSLQVSIWWQFAFLPSADTVPHLSHPAWYQSQGPRHQQGTDVKRRRGADDSPAEEGESRNGRRRRQDGTVKPNLRRHRTSCCTVANKSPWRVSLRHTAEVLTPDQLEGRHWGYPRGHGCGNKILRMKWRHGTWKTPEQEGDWQRRWRTR